MCLFKKVMFLFGTVMLLSCGDVISEQMYDDGGGPNINSIEQAIKCTKGCPCGNSCIDCSKQCNVGSTGSKSSSGCNM